VGRASPAKCRPQGPLSYQRFSLNNSCTREADSWSGIDLARSVGACWKLAAMRPHPIRPLRNGAAGPAAFRHRLSVAHRSSPGLVVSGTKIAIDTFRPLPIGAGPIPVPCRSDPRWRPCPQGSRRSALPSSSSSFSAEARQRRHNEYVWRRRKGRVRSLW
jgi:hypothetical protein